MNHTKDETKKDFLYIDENVKYSFSQQNDKLTINCDHPIFVKRFGSSTANLSLEELTNITQKGNQDYDFFQKFITSLQEHIIDFGSK